jgi:hypothetical protein
MNVKIATLEINECWFTSEGMSLNDIKKYPFSLKNIFEKLY